MIPGVGGSTAQAELKKLTNMTEGVQPISRAEFQARTDKATHLMKEAGFSAVYFNAGTNLYYFTGTRWNPSERMVGVILNSDGQLDYIAPGFEEGTLESFKLLEGKVHCWEEHENPYALFGDILRNNGVSGGTIGIDESAAFFLTDGLRQANPGYNFQNAYPVTAGCRMHKSAAELAIIQAAKNMTMVVLKATARILRPGIPAPEVVGFIDEAHRKVGAPAGSFFCIVLFGEDSQYPHGVPVPQPLVDNDVVLLDTGCMLEGYISDITRTFVYGTPSERHREIWQLEQAAQFAAFNAAQVGARCSSVDDAARKVIAEAGFGPDYQLPGLPHRTGHGTGLDIHEYPYMVRGNDTPLAPGMVASIEPMICMPGEFGIRHEDHFYITEDGPRWFTKPMKSIDDPFGDV